MSSWGNCQSTSLCIQFGWNNIALVDLISIFKNRHKKHTIGEGAAFVYLSGTTTPGSWYSQWHLRTIVQKVYTPSCTVHGSSQMTLMNGFQDLIFISLVCVSKNVYLSSSRVQSALFLDLSRPLAAMSVTALSNPILLQLTDINIPQTSAHRHQPFPQTSTHRHQPIPSWFQADYLPQILSHISQIYIWYTFSHDHGHGLFNPIFKIVIMSEIQQKICLSSDLSQRHPQWNWMDT